MPPKRPRIVPSQTNLSVQDVRDYSTPDGASMANEEMRRLKMALQEVQEKQAADVAAQQIALQTQPAQQAPEKPKETTSAYKWNVKAKAYNSQPVNNNDTVEFIGDYGIDVFAQPGRKITISAINYKWIARAGGNTIDVKFNSVLSFSGTNGVSVTTQNSGILIDRPLTVYQRSIAIGDAGTVGLDFFNEGNQKPFDYQDQIHFQVQDTGDGIRRIIGWYHRGGGGGGGGTDWNASDGTTTVNIADTDTVTWTGINGVTVTLNPVGNIFTINRPLQLRQDGTNVGGQDTTIINWDNDTVTKPAGYTSQAWHEVIDNGAGQRTIKTWIAPSAASYTWNIEANGTVGTQAVVSGATVKFSGYNGIIATRTNDDIDLSIDPEIIIYPPGQSNSIIFGELIFDNTNVDYLTVTTPQYRYGVRKAVDIVHNWDLGNPNNFEFQLMDINIDNLAALTYYRSGATTMSGETIGPADTATGKVRFRNIPHVIGLNRNTVRVYATMSRLKPTEMRFRYFLRRL